MSAGLEQSTSHQIIQQQIDMNALTIELRFVHLISQGITSQVKVEQLSDANKAFILFNKIYNLLLLRCIRIDDLNLLTSEICQYLNTHPILLEYLTNFDVDIAYIQQLNHTQIVNFNDPALYELFCSETIQLTDIKDIENSKQRQRFHSVNIKDLLRRGKLTVSQVKKLTEKQFTALDENDKLTYLIGKNRITLEQIDLLNSANLDRLKDQRVIDDIYLGKASITQMIQNQSHDLFAGLTVYSH